MNRWIKPDQSWTSMINGHPVSSTYFWMAALFSFSALLGITKLALQITGDERALLLWGPSMAGAIAILCVAATGAVRAVRAAREMLPRDRTAASGELGMRAFEKFRVFFFCTVAISLAAWIGVAVIR